MLGDMTRSALLQRLLWSLVVLFIALPGCRSNSDSKKRSQAQTPVLTVKSTNPVGGAEGVARSTTVSVTFSGAIDFATVDERSFAVTGSKSGPVQGVYTYESAIYRVNFTPPAELMAGEKVTVQLSTAVLSPARTPLTAADFSFNIASDPPVPAPRLAVVDSTPIAFANDASPTLAITIRFGEPADSSSVSPGSVRVTSGMTGRVPSRLSVSPDGLTLIITPENRLLAGDKINVQLSSSIKPVSGAPFDGWSYEFRTAASPPPEGTRIDRVHGTLGRVVILEAGDLNQDGLADLVHASENETFVDVLLGNGEGTFTLGIRIDLFQPVLSLALADLDADGTNDLAVGSTDRVQAYLMRSREGAGGKREVTSVDGARAPTGAAVRGITVGDLDHEGLEDFVLDTDRGLQVLLGGVDQRPVQTVGTSRQARTNLVLHDLDLDGNADLLYGDRRGGRVTFHLGMASRTLPLGEARHHELGSDAEQVDAVNLSGEAYPEIVVLTLGGALGAEFRILRRTAPGYSGDTFEAFSEPPRAAPLVGGATLERSRFTAGDLDGNGLLDIILADQPREVVVWYPNTGGVVDFSQGGRHLLRVPEALLPLATDLTGDGSLEVVAAGQSEIHALVPPTNLPEDRFELSIEDTQARQKDLEAIALVRSTHSKPLEAYSVALSYDGDVLLPGRVSIEGTVTGESGVEFSSFQRYTSVDAVSYSVIAEFSAPFENRVIPAGENQLLFRLLFDVLPGAPLGETTLHFIESAGEPKVPTTLIVESRSLQPRTRDGKITVLPPKETPPPGGNSMRIEEVHTLAGNEGQVPALGTNEKNAEAFTSIFSFDPNAIEVLNLDLSASAVGALNPDIFVPSIDNETGNAAMTVIFDITPPIDGIGLAPGTDSVLFMIRFRVKPETNPGTYKLEFKNQIGTPPLNNIFVFGGQSVFPDLVPGSVIVDPISGIKFIRGNADGGPRVNLGDAVTIADFLFRGGAQPGCLDSADTDDNGKLELTDPILLMNHLFKGGPPPAPPYPDEGLDPTPDTLSCSAET